MGWSAPAIDGLIAKTGAGEGIPKGQLRGNHILATSILNHTGWHFIGSITNHGVRRARQSLTVDIVTPTRDLVSGLQDNAGVLPATSNLHRVAHGNVGQILPHFIGAIPNGLRGVAIADLTILTGAPALHFESVEQSANVAIAHGQLNGVMSNSQIHHLRIWLVSRYAAAQHTTPVALWTPTCQRCVLEDGTGGVTAYSYIHHLSVWPKVHKRQLVSHLIGVITHGQTGVWSAQLAIDIRTPALHFPVVEESAGMLVPIYHLQGCEVGTQIQDRQIVAHGLFGLTANICISKTQLPFGIISPALHRRIVQLGTKTGGSPKAEHFQSSSVCPKWHELRITAKHPGRCADTLHTIQIPGWSDWYRSAQASGGSRHSINPSRTFLGPANPEKEYPQTLPKASKSKNYNPNLLLNRTTCGQ